MQQIIKTASEFFCIPENIIAEAFAEFMMNIMPQIQKDYKQITPAIIQDEFMLWMSWTIKH